MSTNTSLHIIVKEATKGKHTAWLDNTQLTKATNSPFYSGARELLCLGFHPDQPIHFTHEGSDVVSMRSTIGKAARWSVEDSDTQAARVREWKPYAQPRSEHMIPSGTVDSGQVLSA